MWLNVLTIALQFLSEDYFKVSQMLRMKAKTKYMAWIGIELYWFGEWYEQQLQQSNQRCQQQS